jgi:small subunit ribosomal protein S4e
MKKINAPRSWKINRKDTKFITRPNSGAHALNFGISIDSVLKHYLGIAKTMKEVKFMLTNSDVLVDGKKRKDFRHNIGLMDVMAIPDMDKYLRMTLDIKGRLDVIEVAKKEADSKICKITGKNMRAGKFQINTMDGRSILLEKADYKVGDSIVVKFDKQEIVKHLPFGEGVKVLLIGGSHKGKVATIESVEGNVISIKADNETLKTLKKYAFVISDDITVRN